MENQKNNRISVIVLNWNNASDTVDCIRSLLRQSHPDKIIILGDNGSEIDDLNILTSEFPDNSGVKIIRFEKNLGFTLAHNILITEALKDDPEYIALLNNDAQADRDWLEFMLKCAQETGAGMVTSKMLSFYDQNKMDNAGHFMLNTGEIIPIGHRESETDYKDRFYNVGPCAGACLYSSRMLKEIGLFDEYFATGYEDAELGLRAVAAGYRSVFEPKAIVRHKMGVSVKKVMNFEYLKKIQLNIFYTYIKIMPAGFILLNLPFLMFKFFAIIIIDIIFLRIRFLKLIVASHYSFITSELRRSLISRKKIRENGLVRMSTMFFLKRTMFFLGFDIMRFYKFIILGNKNQYEK